jgi:hypothetical protein
VAPAEGGGVQDNVRQVAIAGWRSDIKRWCDPWYNEKGGCGELQWTSVVGDTLYGFCHDIPEEDADPIEWTASCKLVDHDNFIYKLVGVQKGTVEVVAKRVKNDPSIRQIASKSRKQLAKGLGEIAELVEAKLAETGISLSRGKKPPQRKR